MANNPGFDFGCEPTRSRKVADRYTGSNLFAAARPDAASAAAAQTIAREFREHYRIERQPLPLWRLHVSLINLGHYPVLPDSLIYHAREALDGLRFEPFEIEFDLVQSLANGSSQPAVLCASKRNATLVAVLHRLAERLDGLGIAFQFDPDFLAHMTLVYHNKPVTPERLAVPIRWTVDRIWLIHSLLSQGRYEFLWPPEASSDAA